MHYMTHTVDKFDQLAQRVNILDALRFMAGISRENIDIGPALEVSDELARRSGRKPNGIFISHASMQTRGLVVGTPTAGGNTVATELRGLVEMLRPRTKVLQAGATVMPGLVGNVAIPRATGAATTYWLAEDEHVTASQQAFDQVAMSPKTVGAMTQVSRKMLLQSSIDVQDFVTRDLITVIGLAVDAAAINGTGGAQPTGLLSADGVHSQAIAGAKPTWAEIVAMETQIAADSADSPRCTYLTSAEVRADLRQVKMNPLAETSDYIWQPAAAADADGQVNGYRALVSQNVPRNLGAGTDEHSIIFGNWADLIIGLWSAVDVQLDPYSLSTSGALRITAFQDLDVAVRHGKSFCTAQYAV